MQLNPYLFFNGQCEEAFKFYAQCLGGKIKATFPYEGTPMADHVPATWRNKVMHTTLVVGDQELMGSDPPPDSYRKPQSFSVTLNFKDPKEGERIFHALSENGTVMMPFASTFWSAGFGMLIDRFGIPWMINCEKAA